MYSISLLADSRGSSDAAVHAAKAYANIEEAINDAYDAAQSALEGANMAGSMVCRLFYIKYYNTYDVIFKCIKFRGR